MSDDLCYFCGKDVGGMYTYYWGNKCHVECEPEYVAKKKTADEITRLRARLEQAERERDNYNAMYESSLVAAVQMKRDGFRAGIEAAAKWLETVPQELQDRQIIVRNIRALPLSPDGQQALNEMLADAWDEGHTVGIVWPEKERNPYRKDVKK